MQIDLICSRGETGHSCCGAGRPKNDPSAKSICRENQGLNHFSLVLIERASGQYYIITSASGPAMSAPQSPAQKKHLFGHGR